MRLAPAGHDQAVAGHGARLMSTPKDRYTDFYRALRDSLQASGARLTTNEKRSDRGREDHQGSERAARAQTVSGRNTPEEYEVF